MDISFLDSYCERAGDASLLAEPINAVTNIAFMVAALMAAKYLQGISPRRAPDAYLLCIILFLIGIGSGLWHLTPSPTTVILDVFPIIAFINLYLAAFLWRGFRWSWWCVALGMGTLQVMNVLATLWFDPNTLHGTIMYLPTYLMLVALVVYAHQRRDWFARPLRNITALWTASLVFRTIDLPVCSFIPFGTHFLWHSINALVLYQLLIILIRLASVPSYHMR